jgi:hypothetical protein
MSPHVSTDSRLTAEKVEKAKSRFAQGMLPGGELYQRRCGCVLAALAKCILRWHAQQCRLFVLQARD